MIRALQPNDIDELRKIHGKYFSQEFIFPDFLNNFLCAFVVTNDKNHIVCGGGVRLIAESILITDKDHSPRERVMALHQVLDASEWLTKRSDFNQLHAFIQDDKWKKCLIRKGFHPTKGEALVLEL